MPNPVNYKIESIVSYVTAGQTWNFQDIGAIALPDPDALSFNDYVWTPNGIGDNGNVPLKMILSPIEPTEYTVSAANFTIAGITASTQETGFPYANGFTWYAEDLPADALPSNISKVTFTDTSIPGTVYNTVEILAWVDSSFVVPNTDFRFKIDIDGDADEIVEIEIPTIGPLNCPQQIGEQFINSPPTIDPSVSSSFVDVNGSYFFDMNILDEQGNPTGFYDLFDANGNLLDPNVWMGAQGGIIMITLTYSGMSQFADAGITAHRLGFTLGPTPNPECPQCSQFNFDEDIASWGGNVPLPPPNIEGAPPDPFDGDNFGDMISTTGQSYFYLPPTAPGITGQVGLQLYMEIELQYSSSNASQAAFAGEALECFTITLDEETNFGVPVLTSAGEPISCTICISDIWDSYGCTDDGLQESSPYPGNPAINYNPNSFINQVSFSDQSNPCEYGGCTNPAAPNWQPMAVVDDGSCLEVEDDGEFSIFITQALPYIPFEYAGEVSGPTSEAGSISQTWLDNQLNDPEWEVSYGIQIAKYCNVRATGSYEMINSSPTWDMDPSFDASNLGVGSGDLTQGQKGVPYRIEMWAGGQPNLNIGNLQLNTPNNPNPFIVGPDLEFGTEDDFSFLQPGQMVIDEDCDSLFSMYSGWRIRNYNTSGSWGYPMGSNPNNTNPDGNTLDGNMLSMVYTPWNSNNNNPQTHFISRHFVTMNAESSEDSPVNKTTTFANPEVYINSYNSSGNPEFVLAENLISKVVVKDNDDSVPELDNPSQDLQNLSQLGYSTMLWLNNSVTVSLVGLENYTPGDFPPDIYILMRIGSDKLFPQESQMPSQIGSISLDLEM